MGKFKRILAVVLTLTLLLGSVGLVSMSFTGASASAETPDDSTVVYKLTTKATTTTVYLQKGGANLRADATTAPSVRWSFDYFIPADSIASGGMFFTRHSNAQFPNNSYYTSVVNESTTGTQYLAVGTVGHIDVTITGKQSTSRAYAGIGGAAGTVYIWNPRAWVDGKEVTLSGVGSTTKTTYGAIAEEVENKTQVYSFTTTSKDTTNQLYKSSCSTNSSNVTTVTRATFNVAAAQGNALRMSFDYYVPTTTEGYFTAKMAGNGNFIGSTFEGIVHESTTGSAFLDKGKVGHLDVEFKSKDGKSQQLWTGIGGAVGTVYIWNIRVQTKAKASSAYVTLHADGIVSDTKTTYGAMSELDIFKADAPLDENTTTSPAFVWTSATKAKGTYPIALLGASSLHYGGSDMINTANANANSYIKMSFDYYNGAADDVFFASNPGTGNAPDTVSVVENTNPGKDDRFLGKGYGSMEFKSVYVNSDVNIIAGISTDKDAKAGKSLYIWNVRYEIYVDGEHNNSWVYPTSILEFTSSTYGDVKEILDNIVEDDEEEEEEIVIPPETVVYKRATTGTGTTFYLTSSSGNIKGAAGEPVRYSFDYYVPSSSATGNFTAKHSGGNFATTNIKGIVHDSTTGSSFLANGKVGHLDVEMQSREGYSVSLYAGIGGAVGTVYVWNLKAWVNGKEVAVTGVQGGSATTFGAIEVEDGALSKNAPATPTFKWTDAPAAKGSTVYGTLGNSTLHYGGSAYIEKAKVTANSYIKMSFDYYNEAANNVFALSNIQQGISSSLVKDITNTNPGTSDIYLGTGFGSVEFKSCGTSINIYAGISTNSKVAADGKDLYIWNVKYEIYVDGEYNNSYVYPTSMTNMSTTTYEQAMNEIILENPVNEWTPGSTNEEVLNFSDYTSENIVLDAQKGDTIKISYEYYTTDATYYRSYFGGKATYENAATGMQLPVGRNQFEQTVTVDKDGTVIPSFGIVTENATIKGNSIRLWNVKITYNDKEIIAIPTVASGEGSIAKKSFDDTTEYDENKTEYMIMEDMRGATDNLNNKAMGIALQPVYIGATEDISVSYKYFISGNAVGTRVDYNTNGYTSAGTIRDQAEVLVGPGTISTSANNNFAHVGPLPSVIINEEKYPNYFYVWDVVLSTENFGTIRYIQQLDFVKGSYEETNFVPYVVEKEYDKNEFTNEAKGIIKGDVNGDDNTNVADVVYLKINNIFKDIRTFDAENDYNKSDADMDYVVTSIWKLYFDKIESQKLN